MAPRLAFDLPTGGHKIFAEPEQLGIGRVFLSTAPETLYALRA
jgi:hypothetical protein